VSARRVSPRLIGYLVVAAGLMAVGVISGRVGLVALGAPFGLVVLMAVALGHPVAEARVHLVEPAGGEVDEGGEATVAVEVQGHRWQVVDVALAVPEAMVVGDGTAARTLRLDADGRAVEPVQLVARGWGRHRLGLGVVRSRDPLGLVSTDRVMAGQADRRVRPQADPRRTAVRPARLRMASGSHPARVFGPGIEFAGLRPYQSGDRPRDLSWRGSARRDELMVIQRHPERSADVVLFIDSFAAEGLDQTVRAALSVARHQLAERDRVGLVVFGGSMRLVRPAAGGRQFRRLAEALVDTRPVFSWAEKEIRAIPPRMLPVGASILAISPLVDQRALAAIADLRRRRHDIGVVEVSPTQWAPAPADATQVLARRLWEMQRDARRSRFAAAGVPVVQWRPDVALELLMAELAARGRGRRWLAS
jgi:uncharacterized protein (DUF58 family)